MNRRQRALLAELAKGWPAAMQFDVSMASYSTLRAGGKAAALIDVHTLADLRVLLERLHEEHLVFRVIGRGSNILVTDKGFPGVMIRLKGEFERIELVEDAGSGSLRQEGLLVKAGGGCPLGRFLSWCTQQGLAGLEFLTGIPGSVGGAVRMNAGASGGEIGDRLHALALLDARGNLITVSRSDVQLSYRKAELAGKNFDALIVVSACFCLLPDTQEGICSRCADFLAQRKGKQPAGAASAGSFFKNPSGDAAGRLIDAAGLKGHCCGEAMVSPVHANFLINTGKGTATDILNLMELVQDRVFQMFAVRLEPEVEII
ncbi:MAG: UDP-N-acetylmuramate dehydrogenase [Candidatus Electrothrix sp. AUS1_2]|nr:UDP-N-acetylmuramate dehydrogenase [Candidatus Electrothrix sp. AUS1_2]